MGEPLCSKCGRQSNLIKVVEYSPIGALHREYKCYDCNRTFTRIPFLSNLFLHMADFFLLMGIHLRYLMLSITFLYL
jgi:DNA-directed RNA polymerase subunit RPC12/RpoP